MLSSNTVEEEANLVSKDNAEGPKESLGGKKKEVPLLDPGWEECKELRCSPVTHGGHGTQVGKTLKTNVEGLDS